MTKKFKGENLLAIRGGQSLVEILVAATVSAVLVAAAVSLIAPVVRSNSYTSRLQVGSALGTELLENVRVFASNDWSNISSLATSSVNIFHIDTQTNPFTTTTEAETISRNDIDYTRYFYVDEVYRDEEDNGSIVETPSGNFLDPSTRRVTVIYRWPNSATNTLTQYVVRSKNKSYFQTNWSDGATTTVVSTSYSGFTTSSNADFESTAGSILIDL
jgi:hypothetical protein